MFNSECYQIILQFTVNGVSLEKRKKGPHVANINSAFSFEKWGSNTISMFTAFYFIWLTREVKSKKIDFKKT